MLTAIFAGFAIGLFLGAVAVIAFGGTVAALDLAFGDDDE